LPASHPARVRPRLWPAAILGALTLLLTVPAVSRADESNPNNYNCLGTLSAGQPEPGSDEQQVKYSFYCNGPISGYQLGAQIPLTGISSPPLVADPTGKALSDTFSCSGEIPGYALNCVGGTKGGWEGITGQFAIGSKLCAEPRVDTLLTVTYAYLEKGVITQAISGPFDLGRPQGCKADAYSGSTRLNPKAPAKKGKHGKKHAKKHKARKSRHHR
jgi:hypothetical protein